MIKLIVHFVLLVIIVHSPLLPQPRLNVKLVPLAMPLISLWEHTRRSPALRELTGLTQPLERVIHRLLARSVLLESIVLEEL
jgi:hypothetical protein